MNTWLRNTVVPAAAFAVAGLTGQALAHDPETAFASDGFSQSQSEEVGRIDSLDLADIAERCDWPVTDVAEITVVTATNINNSGAPGGATQGPYEFEWVEEDGALAFTDLTLRSQIDGSPGADGFIVHDGRNNLTLHCRGDGFNYHHQHGFETPNNKLPSQFTALYMRGPCRADSEAQVEARFEATSLDVDVQIGVDEPGLPPDFCGNPLLATPIVVRFCVFGLPPEPLSGDLDPIACETSGLANLQSGGVAVGNSPGSGSWGGALFKF